MSSKKQLADGLTKSSTRTLLADRLRHHRQKLVWDPYYTSAKRKDAAEREASRNEFAKGKESNQHQPHLQPLTSPLPTTQPHHERMDDGDYELQIPKDPAELYTMEDEDMNEETYEPVDDDIHAEPYEPVEAYVATPKNAKVIKYVIAALTWLPTTSAMHAAPDHEHGQSGIWFFAILAMMLLCLLLGPWLGARYERLRLQQAIDGAYGRLDQMQRENAEQEEVIRRLRCQMDAVAARRDEVTLLQQESQRAADVMAVMMASQIAVIQALQARVDRLRSLIANHQAPCPLGDTVLVQPTLDGSVWHIDPECPIVTLNRGHYVEEHEHCEYCCPRDRNMVTDRAFTGR